MLPFAVSAISWVAGGPVQLRRDGLTRRLWTGGCRSLDGDDQSLPVRTAVVPIRLDLAYGLNPPAN
jgi:hypothetical protein